MEIKSVTNDDGRACAQLLKFLNAARWDLSGADVEELIKTKRWLQDVAGKMAELLRSKPAPVAESSGMKVKAMGPIGGTSLSRKKKK